MNALRTFLLIAGLCLASIELCIANGRASYIVIEWNERAYESAFAEDQFLTFKGQRAHAMMHLAQHDAINHIDRRFYPYAGHGRRPLKHQRRADARAAAAQAAHDVLLSQYPQDRKFIDALLARQLAAIPNGPGKRSGVRVGRRAAAAVLALRAHDGIDREGTYTFTNEPGAYQTTPDWNGFVAYPALGLAKPFAASSGSQFRPGPPPQLESAQYAAAFDEVRRYGTKSSTVRTADQTGYAVWWMEFSEGSVNRLARRLAAQSNMDLWDTARLFALLNTSLIDTYIAVWDSKYYFNHWRPYTAIRAAVDDGNGHTIADPHWDSLRPAPPFPEYVSAHAAGCASAFRVLQTFFPRHSKFTMRSKTAPPGMPARSFRSFREAADECADSRVQLGFHFRYAVDVGAEMGRDVAKFVLEHRLRRIALSAPRAAVERAESSMRRKERQRFK